MRTSILVMWFVAAIPFSSVTRAQVVFEVKGVGSNQTLGAKLVGLGDVNSDGVPDFAAASNSTDTLGARVRVYSGADGQLISQFVGAATDGFGQAIASGDVSANGHLDLVIMANKAKLADVETGKVGVYNPATGVSAPWQTYMTFPSGNIRSLAVIGDRNGDGRSEVLVGSPWDGRIDVLDGANGSTIAFVNFTAFLENPGSDVAALDDVNGDSIGDYAISATLISKVTIRSGLDDSVLRTIHWDYDGSFGASLAGIGDATGDGIMDLAIGTPYAHFNGHASGAVVLVSGATGGGHKLLLADDLPGAIHLGHAVSSIGDIDGDGLADVLVGAPYPHLTGAMGGYVRLYSGSTGDTLRTYTHPQSNAYFGMAIAGIGDRDDDGIGEFVAGAPNWGTTESDNEGLVQWIDPKCSTQTQHGTSCPNPNTGIAASVTIGGCLKPSSSITLKLGGHAGATALLLLGSAGGPTPIGATPCSLHLGSLLPIVFAARLPGGAGAVTLTIPARMPASLAAGTVALQAFDAIGNALQSASAATVLSIY